jgi:aryl-alcohol dehydrogenase-like predicted oxidoreductase
VVDAGYIFASEHPDVSTVLTGTSSVSHLEDNVRALNLENLPASDTQKLKCLFGEIAVYI